MYMGHLNSMCCWVLAFILHQNNVSLVQEMTSSLSASHKEEKPSNEDSVFLKEASVYLLLPPTNDQEFTVKILNLYDDLSSCDHID